MGVDAENPQGGDPCGIIRTFRPLVLRGASRGEDASLAGGGLCL